MKEFDEPDISFNEKKSLQIMKAAIASSKRTLMYDGLLLIIWGAGLATGNFYHWYKSAYLTARWMRNLMDMMQIVIGIGIIGYTVYFIFFQKRKVTTFEAISTRYVWIGVIVAHNIIVMIAKSVLGDVNFVLLQPLQMVLIGFALFVTGGIYRYYLLVAGGIIMWVAAAVCANFELNIQFLIRAIAEVICFIIPGVLMYAAWKK